MEVSFWQAIHTKVHAITAAVCWQALGDFTLCHFHRAWIDRCALFSLLGTLSLFIFTFAIQCGRSTIPATPGQKGRILFAFIFIAFLAPLYREWRLGLGLFVYNKCVWPFDWIIYCISSFHLLNLFIATLRSKLRPSAHTSI